jgi:glycosyltransferase involved in cell wall biosynthesis
MEKISAFIIAYNEEKKILPALQSIAFCDEIIVVDSGSADNTVNICLDFGAKVIHKKWPGYAKQKQFALEQCRYNWCLNIDADERISSQLQTEIKFVLSQKKPAEAYQLSRKNEFLKKMPPRGVHLDYHTRLFKRKKAYYNTHKLVHESISISGKIKKLHAPFFHISKETIAVFQHEIDNYSSLRAYEKITQGNRPSLSKLLLVFPLSFIKKYFLQRAFMFGVRGLILSFMCAYYNFMKEAKLWEGNVNNE